MQESAHPLERKRLTVSSAEVTRERLLNAAARAFARDGLRGATTREIAREAGVNEVTLFRHFKSKEQLLRAVLQRGLASEIALMEKHSSWKENLRESMKNGGGPACLRLRVVLSEEERAQNSSMTLCVSRALSERLVIQL